MAQKYERCRKMRKRGCEGLLWGVGEQQEGEVCLPLREQRKLLTAHTLAELWGSSGLAERSTWARTRLSTSIPRALEAVTRRGSLTRSVQQVGSARGGHLKL